MNCIRWKRVSILAITVLHCLFFTSDCNVVSAQAPRTIEVKSRISSWVVDGPSKRLFVALEHDRSVLEIDFETGEQIREIPMPNQVVGLHIQRGRLLCLSARASHLFVFDLEKNQFMEKIILGGLGRSCTFHPQEPGAKIAYISSAINGQQASYIRVDLDACIKTGQWYVYGGQNRSISPDAKFLLGQDAKNEFNVYGIKGDKSPHPKLLGKFSVGEKTAKKAYGFGHLLVDKTSLDKARASLTNNHKTKIDTHRLFDIPSDFQLIGIWEDRTVFAALKRMRKLKTNKLLVADWSGKSKEKVEFEFKQEGRISDSLKAQMFGNSKEQFVGVSDSKKLFVFDISKVVSTGGRGFTSPLAAEYRLGAGKDFVASLKLDQEDAANPSNVWSIVKAPKDTKIIDGELFVPSGSIDFGSSPIELSLKTEKERHQVKTTLQVGHQEITLGFVAETHSISHDQRHAVFCGAVDGVNYETVVVDLLEQVEVARLSEPSLATQCAIGEEYIYTFNRAGLAMNVYSKGDFSLIKRVSMTGLGEGFSALPDGKIYFEYPTPPRRGRKQSTTEGAGRWCGEARFLEGDLQEVPVFPSFSRANRFERLVLTAKGYHLGHLSYESGSYFLSNPRVNGLTEMIGSDSRPNNFRWGAELYRGKVRNRANSSVLVLNEPDSYPLQELPLGFGVEKIFAPKKCVLTGVFRDLVDFHEVGSVNIYEGIIPVWYQSYLDAVDRRKQFFDTRQRGKTPPPEPGAPPLTQVGLVGKNLAYLFGDRLIFLPTPNFDSLQFAKPLRLTTTGIEQGIWSQPITFRYMVEDQTSPVKLEISSEQSGVKLDLDGKQVTVDPKAVWKSYCQRELARAPTIDLKRYSQSSKAVERRRSYIEKLFGQRLSGVPMCATIRLTATDKYDYSSSVSRSIV